MKNLILNFSWETFSNLPPTQMLAFVVLLILSIPFAIAIMAGGFILLISILESAFTEIEPLLLWLKRLKRNLPASGK